MNVFSMIWELQSISLVLLLNGLEKYYIKSYYNIYEFQTLKIEQFRYFSISLVLQPYLRSWSQDLNAPILSVDYSLAPEAPFPRALEECFYAYCWAIKNHNLLGEKNSYAS